MEKRWLLCCIVAAGDILKVKWKQQIINFLWIGWSFWCVLTDVLWHESGEFLILQLREVKGFNQDNCTFIVLLEDIAPLILFIFKPEV